VQRAIEPSFPRRRETKFDEVNPPAIGGTVNSKEIPAYAGMTTRVKKNKKNTKKL